MRPGRAVLPDELEGAVLKDVTASWHVFDGECNGKDPVAIRYRRPLLQTVCVTGRLFQAAADLLAVGRCVSLLGPPTFTQLPRPTCKADRCGALRIVFKM